MSTTPSDYPPLPPSAPPRRRRHALGLPAGSIRALLALMVLGLLGTIVLLHKEKEAPLLFLYLQYLMFLILAHFFAAHGSTIGGAGDRSPLGLPRGSVRLLLLAGFAGLVAWLYLNRSEVQDVPTAPVEVPIFLLGAFLLGLLLAHAVQRPLARGGGVPYWFQDVQAWLALLAMAGMVIEFLLVVFIKPSLREDTSLNLETWERILAAIVGFYFGARS